MGHLGELFEAYGPLLVFGAVLLEQIGPPIPSGPLLMVAGALTSGASALVVAGLAWLASMLGKIALYILGGRFGRQAMTMMCRLAVSPDANIGKTDSHFERWGASLLIAAEFIPGVRTLAPSLAGAEGLQPAPFLLYSALGAALWTALYLGIGLVFREQIGHGLALMERYGKLATILVAIALGAYLGVRWLRRRRSVPASG